MYLKKVWTVYNIQKIHEVQCNYFEYQIILYYTNLNYQIINDKYIIIHFRFISLISYMYKYLQQSNKFMN